jgi:hypothetical protein
MEVSTPTLQFTPAEREALEALRRQFSPEELERLEKQERRTQAAFERMAAATPEESDRIAGQLWAEQVERPRMVRRIAAARRPRLVTVVVPRIGQRGREQRPAATRRSSSSSSTSSADPGDPAPASAPPGVPPRRGDLRNTHDRLEVLRRDLSSAIALLRRDDLAAVRLRAALDLLDGLLADLERFGVAS